MSNGRGTGGAGGNGNPTNPSSNSIKEKLGQAVSSLVKVAASMLKGVKAVFTEASAEGERVIAQPPGTKPVEVDNKSPQELVKEQIKFSDALKVLGLKALAVATNNPIPMVFAQRIEKNMEERAKAKEKELKRKLKEAQKQEKVTKRKTLEQKYGTAVKQVKTLQQKLKIMQKQAAIVQKQMPNKGDGKQYSDSDKKNISAARSALVKIGFKAKEASNIVNSALSKGSSPTDLGKLIGDSLREADSLKK